MPRVSNFSGHAPEKLRCKAYGVLRKGLNPHLRLAPYAMRLQAAESCPAAFITRFASGVTRKS